MFDETVVMDSEGTITVTLPVGVRETIGLKPGTRLRVETEAGKIHLSRDDEAAVTEIEGHLFITAPLTRPVEDLIAEMREERMNHIMGMNRE